MIDPKPGDIGRKVVYRDRTGWKVEEGVITSFNDTADTGSRATRREDLDWPEARPDPTAASHAIGATVLIGITSASPKPATSK